MFIAIDIGNTNVTVGVLKDARVIHSFRFETPYLKSKTKALHLIKNKIRLVSVKEKDVEAVYVCSVVPSLNKNVRNVLKIVFGVAPVLVGVDVAVPIIIRYRIPAQVGQDRLVNAYAGLKLYGEGLIIIDFGTAITFDILSRRSEYLGGLIVPGLKLMQEVLNKKTALLPYVELARPIEIIGRDTVSSIRAGIVFGVASLCDGIVERLLKKECRGFRIIATGGDAQLIRPYSLHISLLEDFLTLKGLSFIYQSQKKK